MQKLKIKTHKKKDVLDITETVEKALGKRNSGDSGICNLFILHTTAALIWIPEPTSTCSMRSKK